MVWGCRRGREGEEGELLAGGGRRKGKESGCIKERREKGKESWDVKGGRGGRKGRGRRVVV